MIIDNENIVLSGSPIEIAEYDTYKLATFLISVLDEFDLNGRMIPKEAGEAYHATIRGFPIVAKLITDRFGNPVDFRGHEMTVVRDKNGDFTAKFGTTPIGSVVESWIEDREVEGYNGVRSCIMIQAKLWSDRYPEYFDVLNKLWSQNKVKSSWEIKTVESESLPLGKRILKVFSFVGNALLGSSVEGAVPGAGVYEYASLDNSDEVLLAQALSNDMSIESEQQSKEGMNTLDDDKIVEEVNKEPEKAVEEEVTHTNNEEIVRENNSASEPETTSAEEVVANEPTIEESLKATIEQLRGAISQRDEALNKANETIQTLKAEVEIAKPFKESAEKAEKERAEAEKKNKVDTLAQYAKKSGFISESEIAEDGDIKTMISELDEDGIKSTIATRFMDSLNNNTEPAQTETASVEVKNVEEVSTNLNDDDVAVASIVKMFLNK